MLKRSLSEHAFGCFYGSRRIADVLWGALTMSAPPADPFAADGSPLLRHLRTHLTEEIENRHPRLYRLTDLERLTQTLCPDNLLNSRDLPWLDDMFRQLMISSGDYVCYRDTAVQAYVRMTAEMDPTLLVAWHLSRWIEDSHPHPADVIRVVTAQTRFFAPAAGTSLPMAEGHVHLWGITDDGIALSDVLLLNVLSETALSTAMRDRRIGDTPIRMQQLLNALLDYRVADPSTLGALHNDAQTDPLAQSLHPLLPRRLRPFAESALPHYAPVASRDSLDNPESPLWCRIGLEQAINTKAPNHWLWLHLYLCILYRSRQTPRRYRMAILCWFQMLNDLRRALVMDRQGLTRFSRDYFRSPITRSVPSAMADIGRTLFPHRKDRAELKVSENSLTPERIAQFAEAAGRATNRTLPSPPYIFGECEIPLNTQSRDWISGLEQWHFCFHFSRTQRTRTFRNRAEDLWSKARSLRRVLRPGILWNHQAFLGGAGNPSFTFHPANWLRGLDVAGDENDLRIEWFAPALRWLREEGLHCPERTTPDPGFHFSIHSGEDYAHPASGMRHVDETVHFCQMRSGDRLGHALALGILPLDWVQRQGEMILPLDEHVDNLVWLWHHATLLAPRLDLARQVIPLLERRIRRFFPLTNWDRPPPFLQDQSEDPAWQRQTPPYEIETLVKAWLLRRNCYYRWTRSLSPYDETAPDIRTAVPDIQHLNHCRDDTGMTPVALYRNRHDWLSQSEKEQFVTVRYQEEMPHDHTRLLFRDPPPGSPREGGPPLIDEESREELEFLHALQDHLLDSYDRLGLIIETNPTSNIYIARLNSHSEHPIFRWTPPDETLLEPGAACNRFGLRRGPAAVLINTDDPGITPTTLRTEFALLREAAIERGHGRTMAESWLEKLRIFGIEQFRKNHQPVFIFSEEP